MSRLIRFYTKQSRIPFIFCLILVGLFNVLFTALSLLSDRNTPPAAVPITFIAAIALAWHTLRQDTNKCTITLAASAGNTEAKRFIAKLLVSLGQTGLLCLVTLLFGLISLLSGAASHAFNWTALAMFPLLTIAITAGLQAYFVIPYSYFEQQMQRKIGKLALIIPAGGLLVSAGVLRRWSYEMFGNAASSITNPTWGGALILLLHLCVSVVISISFIQWRKLNDTI